MAMRYPLIKPFIDDEVRRRVLEVLDSGYLTEGPVTHEFEAAFRHFTGCRHAIAVTSCTTGLEIALRCLGIGPGDEVIVPDYTYPATASVIPIVGATAVIVDVRADDMLIDPERLERAITPRTKAVIPVSLFGNPLDHDRLDAIAKRHALAVIEDAACSIGAEYKGRRVGRLSDLSVFSLHPRKFITTGEGGMITTDRDDWAAWMNSYKHFGIDGEAAREAVRFVRIGTNCKLSNLQAAVGLAQMGSVDGLLARRRALSERYVALLGGVPGIGIPATTVGGVHSRQSFCIHVADRDRVMKTLRERGIEAQIGTYALHLHPAFQGHPLVRLEGPFPGSRRAFDRCLALPLYHDLTEAGQDEIVAALREALPA